MKATLQSRSIAICVLILALAGCAAKSSSTPGTPTAPTPPQIQVANTMHTLVDGCGTVLAELQAARQSNLVSQGTLQLAEQKFLTPILLLSKKVDAILTQNSDWTVAKALLVTALAQAGVQNISSNIPPNAAPYVATALTLYNTIATTVGAPTI